MKRCGSWPTHPILPFPDFNCHGKESIYSLFPPKTALTWLTWFSSTIWLSWRKPSFPLPKCRFPVRFECTHVPARIFLFTCFNFRFTNLSLRTIILLVASILSFIPQFRLLLVRRDSSGLSLYYVFLNLLGSIELVTVAALFVVTLADVGSDTFVNEPPDTGDWINLTSSQSSFCCGS